jgi:hypothetical protein
MFHDSLLLSHRDDSVSLFETAVDLDAITSDTVCLCVRISIRRRQLVRGAAGDTVIT